MPRKCTDNWIADYCRYTTFQESPLQLHTWTAISTIAGALNRRIYIRRGSYKLFPNLYIALVAPSGVIHKTTAANIGMDMLDEVDITEMMRGKLTSYHLLHWFQASTQSVGECCCTIYAPEMRNLILDHNRSEVVTLLTDYFDCPNNPQYRTKEGGKMQFKNIYINLLGCSTPEWLTLGTTIDEVAGGFTGRFVYVYADTTDRSIPFPEDLYTRQVADMRTDLVHDLAEIAQLTGQVILTNQAKAEYIVWYNARKSEWKDERLMGYYSRKGDLLLKLAMVISASSSDSLVIDTIELNIAKALLKAIEQPMAKAFAGIVEDPALRYKDTVLSYIARSVDLKRSRDEILKWGWRKFDGQVLDRITTNLIEAKVVQQSAEVVGAERKIMYRIIDKTFI